VEEEHAVPLRPGHLARSRMAVSHRPLGPASGPTVTRLRPISRRPQARPRDPHRRGLPQLPHGRRRSSPQRSVGDQRRWQCRKSHCP